MRTTFPGTWHALDVRLTCSWHALGVRAYVRSSSLVAALIDRRLETPRTLTVVGLGQLKSNS
eukprot:13971421-Heterocapsa_arctica.AAC.1